MIDYSNDNLLYKLLDGRVKCAINNASVYICKPSLERHIEANGIYDEVYQKMISEDALTEESTLPLLLSYKIWTQKEEDELKGIDKVIDDSKVELYHTYMAFKSGDKIKKQLAKLRKRKIDLIIKRGVFDTMMAEYEATVARVVYLIWAGAHCKGRRFFRTPFWSSDFWTLSTLLTSYNKSLLQDEKIRELCKMGRWRVLWGTSRSISGLFGRSLRDLTDNQLSLISWSKFYDGVARSMDSPPDEVINDDDMLDGWAIVMNKKRADEKNKGLADKAASTHSNADEIFIVADNSAGAARINSLNDQYGRMIQRQKLTQAEKHGQISDFEMPVVKQELAMKINAMKKPGVS